MAGKQIRLQEKTLYDKVGDNLAANGVVKLYLATNVDVSGYLYATLVLRVHQWSVGTGSPFLYLQGISSAPTTEDPLSTFRGGVVVDGNVAAGKITFGTTAIPAMTAIGANVVTGSVAAAGFLDVLLAVNQGATLNSPMSFVVSADLILRS